LDRRVRTIAICGLVALVAACEQPGPGVDADQERNPYYRKAKALQEERDFQGAVESYRKALEVEPGLAGAHFALGLLYDDKLGDPVAAIYHYRRYLDLKPDSDKRQLVEDFIERAKLSLVAKLPQSPVVDPGALSRLQSEKAALLQENQVLKARVAELEKNAGIGAARPPPPAAAGPGAAPPSPTSREPGPARTHVVQKGDTLYSLALQYYGTRTGWEKIYQANRNALPNRDQLKIGQELVIP
jgi:tetratricopeptide (TPR) repeat protein